MGSFVRGDVIVLPFPFADNTGSKRRPALIVSVFSAKELIVCAITTQTVRDDFCVPLYECDFEEGGIKSASYIRPNYIFTVRTEIIAYKAGHISTEKMQQVLDTFNYLISLG